MPPVTALPILRLLAVLALSSFPAPAFAQPSETADAVARLFEERMIDPDWFAETFLEEVTVEQVGALVAGLRDEFGPLQDVSGSGTSLTVLLDGAEVPTSIQLDPSGRIAGLFFEAPIPTGGTLENLVAAVAALPGEASVLILTDGAVRASHNPDVPLAVGSAAKLAILKALDEAVAAGSLSYDEAVELLPGWQSLPSGILQDWPEGTPLTLATLAGLMISISDNTATDALIDIVGREPIEAITPRNTPFATTAELFKLKATGNAELLDAWTAGDQDGRRAVLQRAEALALPAAGDLRHAPEAEWFMSATEICELLEDVAPLPAMRINAGLADRSRWASVAFKGGSDTGVLNFSTRLAAEDGEAHCVVATWNGEAGLDQQSLSRPYRGILRALEARTD